MDIQKHGKDGVLITLENLEEIQHMFSMCVWCPDYIEEITKFSIEISDFLLDNTCLFE